MKNHNILGFGIKHNISTSIIITEKCDDIAVAMGTAAHTVSTEGQFTLAKDLPDVNNIA